MSTPSFVAVDCRCGVRHRIAVVRPTARYRCYRCGTDLAVPGTGGGGEVVWLYGLHDPPPPTEGTPLARIGRYELHQELGRGGMGVVYKAWDADLSRFVALKLLVAGEYAVRVDVERLLREARAAARLDHPGLVRVHDIGRDGGRVFFTMDHVEGPSLREVRERLGRVPVREAARVVAAVAEALHHAHLHGLVHRDVKPANVLLEPEGTPVVTDFGLAKELGDGQGLTRSDTMIGTPAYMAPEQAAGRIALVGPRTDVYALGAVLYELLVGRPAYEGDNALSVVMRVLSEPPRSPRSVAPDLPVELAHVVERAMARDPEDRYPTAQALTDDLRRFLAGEPVSARPHGVLRRARSLVWAHRRTGVVAVAALGVVALGAVAVDRWAGSAEHERREALAEERRAAVSARIEVLLAAGDPDGADRLFRAFVEADEHRGTDALARAWLEQAPRARARPDDGLRALAAAYTATSDPALQEEALVGLAAAFHRAWSWERLDAVLDTIERRAAVGPDIARLRLDAALALRDLDAAAGALRSLPEVAADVGPLVEILRTATPAEPAVQRATVAEVDGPPPGELLLQLPGDPRVHVAARDLPLRSQAAFGFGPLGRAEHLGTFGPDLPLFASFGGDGDGVAALLSVDEPDQPPILAWDENFVHDVAAGDLDGDGLAEVYVAAGAYGRRLMRARRDGATWTVERADPGEEHVSSDFTGVEIADLDGDGRPELVATIGPWWGYGVRVWRDEGHGLVTVAHRRLGDVSDPVVLEGGVVAVLDSDTHPSARALPRDAPFGEPAGVHLLRVAGRTLETVRSLPIEAPRSPAGELALGPLLAGDLDGDGRTDLVVGVDHGRATVLFRQRADGDYARILVGSVRPLALADLDDDPARELLVNDEEGRTFVLGAGTDGLPRVASGGRPTASSRPAEAPAAWDRAEDLAAMGLPSASADAMLEVAALAVATPLERSATFRAAELRELDGDTAAAAVLYARVAEEDDELGVAALDREVGCHVHDHAFERALAASTRLLSADRAPEDRIRERHRWLLAAGAPHDRVEVRFDAPLSPAWHGVDPTSVARDPAAGALHVVAFADQGPLAALPLRKTGERLRLEAEVEIERTELRVALVVGLRAVDTGASLSVQAKGMGGGGLYQRRLGCDLGRSWTFGRAEPVSALGEVQRVVAIVEWVPAVGEAWCEVEDADGRLLLTHRTHAPAIGGDDWELVIEASPDRGTDATLLVEAKVHRLVVEGAIVAPPAPSGPLDRAATLLADGDARGALEALRGAPAADPLTTLRRAMALRRLGRNEDAAAALGPAVRAGERGVVERGLAHLLRGRPEAWVPPAKRLPTFPELYALAWSQAAGDFREDPAVARALLRDLSDLGPGRAGDPVRAELLAHRALARWTLLRDPSAQDELVAAIGRLPADADPELRFRLHAALVDVELASGRPDAALVHARSAGEARSPELAAIRLALLPTVAAVADRTEWREVLSP